MTLACPSRVQHHLMTRPNALSMHLFMCGCCLPGLAGRMGRTGPEAVNGDGHGNDPGRASTPSDPSNHRLDDDATDESQEKEGAAGDASRTDDGWPLRGRRRHSFRIAAVNSFAKATRRRWISILLCVCCVQHPPIRPLSAFALRHCCHSPLCSAARNKVTGGLPDSRTASSRTGGTDD